MKSNDEKFVLREILKITNRKEQENLKTFSRNELEYKIKSITEIVNELDGNFTLSLTSELFEKIRSIAVRKGGFLLNSYRKEIYKKVFLLNDEAVDLYNFNEINGNKKLTKQSYDLKRFYNYLDSKEPHKEFEIPLKRTTKRDEYIIEVDVKRTIANSYYKNCEDELNVFKEKLTKFLKLFFDLNPQYGYYQGFHDVALYIYLMFYNFEHLAIQMLQRIAEFYLKDYMVEIENETNNESIKESKKFSERNFQFQTVFDVLNSITAENDKQFWRFIQENTDNSNAINTLPWIITLFTHDVQDLCLQLRILDYILFSHPNVVYQMASYVSIINLLLPFYFLDNIERSEKIEK